MSVVIFASGESEFMPLPGVYAVATRLQQAAVTPLVIRHLFRMSDQEAWAVCRHLMGQVRVVVVHINLPVNATLSAIDAAALPAIRARVALVKAAFQGQVWLMGTGGLFQFGGEVGQEIATLFDETVVDAYGFEGPVLRALGLPPLPAAPALARKAIDMWPRLLAGHAAPIMLQPEPCLALCGMCPRIQHCNWQDIPTWERTSDSLKEAFAAELRRNVDDYGITHFMLVDFQTDASLAKVKWLRQQFRRSGQDLKFAANLVLDNLMGDPCVVEELLEAGLTACNLQIGSLRADSRRAQGFRREDGWELLQRLRQRTGAKLWVMGHLAIGMPADTPTSAEEDLAVLTSAQGRATLDAVQYVAQAVLPGAQLAVAGAYRFQEDQASPWGIPVWRGPHLDYGQAEALASQVMAGYYRGNLLGRYWDDASSLMSVANLGLDVQSAIALHRQSWRMSPAKQVEWRDKLGHLEALVVRQHAMAVQTAHQYG